ncbi:DUF5703 family protein [Serinibacter salmoneus]|uniref:Uncharacterized protein n=1 Tax=Serinibacter salmoneus TaxID=556530 RepID=A0A2A9CZG5_9MICO|nr:DUF5703 family protein [Serinibacter salmoneus]PFG19783.1 hypothetical protein ATL40_1353 [Serinibacter salmoneus]
MTDAARQAQDHGVSNAIASGSAARRTYEFRVVTLPRSASRGDVRRLLTDEAEYGRWELARTVHYLGGQRKVWLRRRVLRVAATL